MVHRSSAGESVSQRAGLGLEESLVHPGVYMLSHNPVYEQNKKRFELKMQSQTTTVDDKRTRTSTSARLTQAEAITHPKPSKTSTTSQNDSSPPTTPLTRPFPRPAPRLVVEADLVRTDIPRPNRVPADPRKNTIEVKDIEAYAVSTHECLAAWKKKGSRESIKITSAKFISVSRTFRRHIARTPTSTHWAVAIKDVDSWELLLSGHSAKVNEAMSPAVRDRYREVGEYLVHKVQEGNDQLVKLAGMPLGFDSSFIKEVIGRINAREFEKEGFLARLVKDTLGKLPARHDTDKMDIPRNERKVPDVALYPTVQRSTSNDPRPPVPSPQYFDQNSDPSLVDLSLDLRAAVVAYHLVFHHHQATGHTLPVPQNGKHLHRATPLKQANLPTLVRHLTDHFESLNPEHVALTNAFFRFFRSLVHPTRLLQLLIDRYNERPAAELSSEDAIRWHADHVFTKLFIVRILARWLECYYLHAHDHVVLRPLRDFTMDVVAQDEDLPPSAARLITLQLLECHAGRRGITYIPVLERAIAEGEKHAKVYPETAFRQHMHALERLKVDGVFDVADVLLFHQDGGPEELARAITRMAAVGFQRYPPSALLLSGPLRVNEGGWVKDAQGLTEVLVSWATRTVLALDRPETRAKAFEVIVEIAWTCHQMRNFLCSFALTIALTNDRLQRLHQTHQYVSTQHRSYLQHLLTFFGSEGNGAYHRELRRHVAPAVPHIVAVYSELHHVNKGRTESATEVNDEVGLIDCDWLRSVGRIIGEVESCYIPYKIPVLAVVAEWLEWRLAPLEGAEFAKACEELDSQSWMYEPKH